MLECMLVFPKHHRTEFRNLHFTEKCRSLNATSRLQPQPNPHMLKLSLWRDFLLLLVKSKDDRKVSLLKAKTEKESLHLPHGRHVVKACYILQ